jgi:hypothetical protein
MVGRWGIQSKKKVHPLTYLVHKHSPYKLSLSPLLMLCTLSTVHNTPSRKSARLALLEKRPSSSVRLVVPDLFPNLPTLAPPNPQTTAISLEAHHDEDGLMVSQPLHEGPPILYDDCLDGRQSSIEGDSSEGSEEVGSMEANDLEEMLGWPLELLFAPLHGSSEHRKKERVGADKNDINNNRPNGGETSEVCRQRGRE